MESTRQLPLADLSVAESPTLHTTKGFENNKAFNGNFLHRLPHRTTVFYG